MTTASTPLWTAAEAARATGGRAVGDWRAMNVVIDSRAVTAGDLFVAIRGDRQDGHAFAADALTNGAAGVVVRQDSDAVAADAPGLRVADTTRALEDLGRAARARSNARIVAVTGSVGKTGSKEALRLVLADQGPTHATEGNLNNQWGLPLSLARLPVAAKYAVFELGMNHPGEIRPLVRMARPHVALITTVAEVHSEFFASVEEIADAKAEIFEGLEPGGTAVLNRDIAVFERLAEHARAAGVENIVTFGAHAEADLRLVDLRAEENGSAVTAEADGQVFTYRIGAAGRHWAVNSLGVLAACRAAGADMARAAEVLAQVEAPKGRGSREAVALPDGDLTLIDESYNASPVAVAAAVEVLAQARPGAGGRRIAVLGDMLELGARSADLHAGLAAPLKNNGIDLVFTCGPETAHLNVALPEAMRGGHAASSADLAPLVVAAVRAGDVVLVKGSYGSRMGAVVDALRALAGGDAKRAVNGG